MARIFRKLAQLLDVDLTSTPPGDGDGLVYDAGAEKWVPGAGGGGGGAPTDVNYLVGTADSGLSAEIVVGTTPGGELGGTWASPTVDATHSGSSHASVQAAAEATAAGALSSHASDTTGVHGIADTSDLIAEGDSRLTDSRTPSGPAGGVLGGTYPNPSFAADMATQAELDAHLNDTTDAHDASAISVLDTNGDYTATDVEGVLAEIAPQLGGGGSSDGWTAAGETWTYASADDPTFTFTISGVDLTTKYSPGMRVKLTQTTAKYFIITKVSFSTDTTVTVYGGTDYDLANASITSPYYSTHKAPFGFPLDPTKWTVTLISDATDQTSNPGINAWDNPGSLSGNVPIGSWRLKWTAVIDIDSVGQQYVSLSTANNSETDNGFTFMWNTGGRTIAQHSREKVVTVTSKTTYYLVVNSKSQDPNFADFRGDFVPTLVTAVSAYL